jgi:NADPH:quinone reductase
MLILTEKAAAYPMVYATSYLGIVMRGQCSSSDTVLVHAAAGGVGLAAVQIAKSCGATVIGTCGSQEKCKVVLASGADHVINYREDEQWPATVRKLTNGKGATLIYDPVGGDVFAKSLKCIAWKGRLLVVGFVGGIPTLAMNKVLLKNISIIGVYLGSHMTKDPSSMATILTKLHELYAQKKIDPQVSATYPLEDVQAALKRLASRQTWGKVVLTLKQQTEHTTATGAATAAAAGNSSSILPSRL